MAFLCHCCDNATPRSPLRCSRCGFPATEEVQLRRALGLPSERRVAPPPRSADVAAAAGTTPSLSSTPSPDVHVAGADAPTVRPQYDGGGGAADADGGIERAFDRLGRLEPRWFEFNDAHLAALGASYYRGAAVSDAMGHVRVAVVQSFLDARASLILQRQKLLAARSALGEILRRPRPEGGDLLSSTSTSTSTSTAPSPPQSQRWTEPLFAGNGAAAAARSKALRRSGARALRAAIWGAPPSSSATASATATTSSSSAKRSRGRDERDGGLHLRDDDADEGREPKRLRAERTRAVLLAELRSRCDAAQRQWRESSALFRVSLLDDVARELEVKIAAAATLFAPACDPLTAPALLLERRVVPASFRSRAPLPPSSSSSSARDLPAPLQRTMSAGAARQSAMSQRLAAADGLDGVVQTIRLWQRLYVCVVACTSV